MRFPNCLALFLGVFCLLTDALPAAENLPTPLLALDFEHGLKNTGTAGGNAAFKVYAAGQEATWDVSAWGKCVDLTAASRNGGSKPNDPPSGSSVTFQSPKLAGLNEFTIVLWSRRNPLVDGSIARLLVKDGDWDLIPNQNSLSLSLGTEPNKTPHNLYLKSFQETPGEWRFTAVSVSADKVTGFGGTLTQALISTTVPRQHKQPTGTGTLQFGNLSGIRPFNGWLDNIRVYGSALGEAQIHALYDADVKSATTQPARLVYDFARPSTLRYPPVIKPSDIPFSIRWQQRTGAVEVMQSFHSTQCLWVYGNDRAFADRIHKLGIGYEGTLNGLQRSSKTTDDKVAAKDPTGRHEDLDGNKNMPSWMVTFKPPPWTGCVNSPAFREIFFAAGKNLVDIGVDMIHVDDWAMNASWVRNAGVCFCDSCRKGFRGYLKTHLPPAEAKKLGITNLDTFDYRAYLKSHGVPDAASYRKQFRSLPLTPYFNAFQVESTRKFYADFRQKLDEWSPKKHIAISVNTMFTRIAEDGSTFGIEQFDFIVGEMYSQTFADHLLAGKSAEAFGVGEVVSPIPRSFPESRSAIATIYALGQTHLVPWDLYMGSDATGIQPRYFGTREQYGDLYDFIHEHKPLFDNYRSAAEVGVLFNTDEPSSKGVKAFCERLAAKQIPFHLILTAQKNANVPLRESDLDAIRLLIAFSPVESLSPADQKRIQAAQEKNGLRMVSPDTDLAKLASIRGFDWVSLEGPSGIYTFPRVNPQSHSATIHLVNWNAAPDKKGNDQFQHITLTLKHLAKWGKLREVWLHQPGHPSQKLIPELHPGYARLTIPQLDTWAVIEVKE